MNKIVKIGDALCVIMVVLFVGMIASAILWATKQVSLWVWGITTVATLGSIGGLKICNIALSEWLKEQGD